MSRVQIAKKFIQEEPVVIVTPECFKRGCIHFIGVKNDGDESTERVVCKAFTDQIPDDIAYGNDPHLVPQKGDNGITFQSRS